MPWSSVLYIIFKRFRIRIRWSQLVAKVLWLVCGKILTLIDAAMVSKA
jgi:hypothetical protein